MMKMKNIIRLSSMIMLLVLTVSCGKDNYEAPESTLMGKIVYNGTPIQVRGTGEAVRLQLFQDGWQLNNPVEVFVAQDGTFTAKLFDGEYKMVTRDKNGPWVNTRDTMVITLKGSANIDLNVTPYFTVSGENLSISGTTCNVSLTINQVVSTAKLEKVYLVLSKTQFADEVNNIFRQDISGVSVGTVNLSAEIGGSSDVANAKALYGRVGVKTEGTEQAVWTPVVKLK
jgi:hypothetical protein